MDARRSGLKEPFNVESSDDTESLSNKLSENIEAIVEAVQNLEDYGMLLGTKNDTKTMRKKMKDHITDTNSLIKKTGDLLRQFEALKPKRKEEADARNKILKRTKENYSKQSDRFTKIFKDIQSKEKIYIEARKSVERKPGSISTTSNSDIESNIQVQSNDLDFTETLFKEREADIQEVRRLAHELNLTAQYQAQKIQEASEDIVVIQDQAYETEKNAEMANKELEKALQSRKKSSIRNIICLILILCVVVGLLTFGKNLF